MYLAFTPSRRRAVPRQHHRDGGLEGAYTASGRAKLHPPGFDLGLKSSPGPRVEDNTLTLALGRRPPCATALFFTPDPPNRDLHSAS